MAQSPFAFWTRAALTVGLIQRNKLPVYLMYPSLRVGEGMLRMTLPDYVAIGVLIVLIACGPRRIGFREASYDQGR